MLYNISLYLLKGGWYCCWNDNWPNNYCSNHCFHSSLLLEVSEGERESERWLYALILILTLTERNHPLQGTLLYQ